MSRSFPSLRRGLLVAALAAAAPLQLMAAVTLSLRDLPPSTQGGQTLVFRLETGGDCAGRTATVAAFLDGAKIFTTHLPLRGPDRIQVTIPTPAVATLRSLVIQASCEGTLTTPASMFLLPPRPGLDLAPEDKYAHPGPTLSGKRARVEGPSASPAAPKALGTPLQTLPDDLILETAEYAGADAFRYLSRHLNRVAQLATGTAVIQGDVTDAELAARLRTHSRIHTIRFDPTPKLTPEGIVRALEECQGLRSLTIRHARLTFQDLFHIVASHDHLVSLHVPEMTISDAELAALPPRFTALAFRSSDAGDVAISRFQQLRVLNLQGSSRFTGDHLPASLQALTVSNCSAFTGMGLPVSLTRVELRDCAACTGPLALPNLEALDCIRCGAFTTANLQETFRTAPKLQSLAIVGRNPPTLLGMGLVLPTGLRRLVVADIGGLAETAFEGLNRLEYLNAVRVPGFTSRFLPRSLRTLFVCMCPEFRSSFLGALPLHSLGVTQCSGYANDGLPESLRVLWVAGCAAGNYGRLRAELPRLCHLRKLSYLGNGDVPVVETDHPLFRAHPTLEIVQSAERCAFEHDRPWVPVRGQLSTCWLWRPTAPAATPAAPAESREGLPGNRPGTHGAPGAP